MSLALHWFWSCLICDTHKHVSQICLSSFSLISLVFNHYIGLTIIITILCGIIYVVITYFPLKSRINRANCVSPLAGCGNGKKANRLRQVYIIYGVK